MARLKERIPACLLRKRAAVVCSTLLLLDKPGLPTVRSSFQRSGVTRAVSLLTAEVEALYNLAHILGLGANRAVDTAHRLLGLHLVVWLVACPFWVAGKDASSKPTEAEFCLSFDILVSTALQQTHPACCAGELVHLLHLLDLRKGAGFGVTS